MQKFLFKKAVCVICLSLITVLLTTSVNAVSAGDAYSYDSWGNSLNAPTGYEQSLVFGNEASERLSAPSDLYYSNGRLYVLDAGNNRIMIYGKDYIFEKAIDRFYTVENGEKNYLEFNEAQGIFVSDSGLIYIADKLNARVLILKESGEVISILKKPETENFPDALEFKPINVVADDIGNTYVLAEGFYYGTIVYDSDGNYKSFYGASKVKATASMIADLFWRKFMTGKQLEYTRSYLPSAFASLDIDGKSFIYTITSENSGAIRKLNYLGDDIFEVESGPDPLDKSVYGDYASKNGTSFADIAVSEENFVFALDKTKGRVFQYDKDSNLINVFGALGDIKGTFELPVAVETVGRDVLVLDQDKSTVTVFSPTDYGNLISNATVLYHNGKFDEAFEQWQKVLAYNSNCELAMRGIGRAYLQQGKYFEAMKYAKLGQDRLGYSKAFRFYRSNVARKYFVPATVIAVLVLLLIVVLKKNSERIRSLLHINKRAPRLFAVKHIIFHPVDFYERLCKDTSADTVVKSVVSVVLLFIGSVMNSLATGFIFNPSNITEFNAFFVTAQSFGVVAIWVVSDKVVGSLRFGHATLRSSFCGMSAALIPYTFTLYLNVFLSHILVYEEKSVMGIITAIGLMLTVFLMYQSVRITQKYDALEALWSMLLNVLVAVVIILLMIIVYMLVRQMVIFGSTVYSEIAYRIN